MAIDPWAPESSVGPARGVGPAPVGRSPANNFGAFDVGPVARGAMFAGGMAVPGLGLVSTGLNANNVMANNAALAAAGRPGLNFGQVVGGLLGFNGYGRGLSPNVKNDMMFDQWSYTGNVPQAAPEWEGTPSQGYFDGINDLNNVGRLGEVLDARGVPGAYEGGAGDGGGMSSADSHGAQEAAQGPGNEGGMYRKGGIVPHDGDGKLEARKATLHETEGVLRPEAMAQIGPRDFHAINKGGREMREAMARILMRG